MLIKFRNNQFHCLTNDNNKIKYKGWQQQYVASAQSRLTNYYKFFLCCPHFHFLLFFFLFFCIFIFHCFLFNVNYEHCCAFLLLLSFFIIMKKTNSIQKFLFHSNSKRKKKSFFFHIALFPFLYFQIFLFNELCFAISFPLDDYDLLMLTLLSSSSFVFSIIYVIIALLYEQNNGQYTFVNL